MLEEITHEGAFSHKVMNEELEPLNTKEVKVEWWGGMGKWTQRANPRRPGVSTGIR